MKKIILSLIVFFSINMVAYSQEEAPPQEKGFKKENFFSGGSIALSFFNSSFLIGANPVFGYSLAKWVDIGVVGNYNYASYHDYYQINDRLHQSIYGGGFFTRLFPVKFLFAQGQMEHNWISQKYFYTAGGQNVKDNVSSNSLLVGAGYTTGRDPVLKSMYGYFAILFDVLKEKNSPYVTYDFDNYGNIINTHPVPIIRAGINIPLFQGKR
jgi:hypothetical protein